MDFEIPISPAERRAGRLNPPTRLAATESFRELGLCVLHGALPTEQLDGLAAEAETLLGRFAARAVAQEGAIGVGMEAGYAEVVQRAPGRFDLLWDRDHPRFAPLTLSGTELWRTVIAELLGDEHQTMFSGLLMAQPHAAEQRWHTDGEHLFPGQGPLLPAHCLNVFIPLVDVHAGNGPTEFCPGSHRLTVHLPRAFEQDGDLPERVGFTGPTATPEVPRGSVVIFDYRVVHRARPNLSEAARPVLYVTHAAPWFQDIRNFPARPLFASVE